MKVLVTGGAGFIGSEFVRQGVKAGYDISVVDKLSYAGDMRRLGSVKGKFRFYKVDICDKKKLEAVFRKEKPSVVAHFAAESHVDRSIEDASPFIDSNVKGTQFMLDCAKDTGVKKFVHVSTDEVYGEIEKGKFTEESPFNPNSPYSVSKAAADMLARAYFRTYGLPVVVVRPSNNYGPWQFPEKLIPVAIHRVKAGRKIPVYGKGLNVREWLYVEDCSRAVWIVLKKGRPGESYNIGSGQERKNIDTVRMILSAMNASADMIEFVKDRPGHDIRYSLDVSKISKELGWKASVKFPEGLRKTVEWYRSNNY